MTAKQDLIETLAGLGKIAQADASRVANLYISEGFVVLGKHAGGYTVTHGQYFDRATITGAVDFLNA